MSPTKSSGKATKKAGKAQKSVMKSSGEKVKILTDLLFLFSIDICVQLINAFKN